MMSSTEVSPQFAPSDTAPAAALSQKDRAVLKQFHQQIQALGALWILVGTIVLLLGLYLSLADNPLPLRIPGTVVVMVGCIWLCLGVLTCLKKMPALTAGLVFSYLFVLASIAGGGGPGALLIMGIFQGHRVRGMAKKLAAKDIALT